jgi:hypothetical protein
MRYGWPRGSKCSSWLSSLSDPHHAGTEPEWGVSKVRRAFMDLFATLGVSRAAGLLAAAFGLAVAALMAFMRARRSARDATSSIRLSDRD